MILGDSRGWNSGIDIRLALEGLPQVERQVLELRFGLFSGEPHTLQGVGDELGLTRERVRQLETQAIERLRSRPGDDGAASARVPPRGGPPPGSRGEAAAIPDSDDAR